MVCSHRLPDGPSRFVAENARPALVRYRRVHRCRSPGRRYARSGERIGSEYGFVEETGLSGGRVRRNYTQWEKLSREESASQESPIDFRGEDAGKSEGRSVTQWIESGSFSAITGIGRKCVERRRFSGFLATRNSPQSAKSPNIA